MYRDEHGHIHVFENTWDNAEDYDMYFGPYTYWTYYKTLDEKLVFIVTGSVNLIDDLSPQQRIPQVVRDTFVGSDSQHWKDAWLHIHVSLPNIPNIYSPATKKFLQIENALPMVTLNGIDKGGDNHNGGWQLYNFGVTRDIELYSGGHDPVTNPPMVHDVFSIWAHFGLRGALFRLARVGFSLTVTGLSQ